MPRGKVKWFDAKKGFGFIQPDEGGPDIFIHKSVVQASGLDTLTEAQAVEYEIQETPKGVNAGSVKPVEA